MIIFKML